MGQAQRGVSDQVADHAGCVARGRMWRIPEGGVVYVVDKETQVRFVSASVEGPRNVREGDRREESEHWVSLAWGNHGILFVSIPLSPVSALRELSS